MPDRIIRERALTSPSLDRLSDGGERLHWRLVPAVDDYGRFDANPLVVRSKCFPLRTEKRLRVSIVEMWLRELVQVDDIRLYTVAGRQYGYFVHWFGSQRKRESRAKFPDPPDDTPSEPLRGPICASHAEVSASPQVAANGGNSPQVAAYSESREPRAESREAGVGTSADALAPHPPGGFKIPESIEAMRARCPILGAAAEVWRPAFWQAQIRAHPGVDFPRETLKAEAWLVSHPKRRKKDHAAFLSNWFQIAEERGD